MATANENYWIFPPSPITLAAGEVHIWKINVALCSGREDLLTGLLSQNERERIFRFMQVLDRQRGILARAALRDILGRYYGINPRHWEFVVTGNGKPLLNPHRHPNGPHFNVSHSGDIILIAFSCNHNVGVDVEIHRDNLDVINIAQRFFAPPEVRCLLDLADALRISTFFKVWTRKEAYLKARGIGISAGLNRFVVTLSPQEPARLVSDECYPEEIVHWSLHDIPLELNYSATVAIHGGWKNIRYWQWEGLSQYAS